MFCAPALHAQVLDHTLVPKGRLRLQASPVFESWDTRFGRAASGEAEEKLGEDLTDPTSLSLFPGIASLASAIEDASGTPLNPAIGAASGLIRQDVTRIEFGGHVGITEWLTVGAVVPWTRTRSTVDVAFAPDSANANLGLNPLYSAPTSVDLFLSSTGAAEAAAAGYASTQCSSGPSPTCTSAQDLASRVSSFDGAVVQAYAASSLFPLAGTAVGDALLQSAAQLDADLTAAGLPGLAPVALSTSPLLDEGDLAGLAVNSAAGFGYALPLATRQSLWSTGDVEASARIRVLDNLTPTGPGWTPPGLGYRVTGSFLMRLPTGTPPAADIALDLGTGDRQLDLEGGFTATVRFGRRLGLTAGGAYGVQGSTTVTRRVAPPEQVLVPVESRTQLTWRPGSYVSGAIVPTIHIAPSITLAGEYRLFHKRRDEFELVTSSSLDPTVLALESGVKAHVLGGGIRYDTVDAWRRGDASLPIEIHLRLLATVAGSGGQVPKATRVEAGLRLFCRLWGPATP
ncbi:MAG: hypothetical protein HKO77_08010 [Gemmatimonadetes bacterium]|nr:hypothetical protein [Gemmatimonadota bacterium]